MIFILISDLVCLLTIPLTPQGNKAISHLATALKPRYHFVFGPYYERMPYRNHKILNEKCIQCTRFISLNAVGQYSFLKLTQSPHQRSDNANGHNPNMVTIPIYPLFHSQRLE